MLFFLALYFIWLLPKTEAHVYDKTSIHTPHYIENACQICYDCQDGNDFRR